MESRDKSTTNASFSSTTASTGFDIDATTNFILPGTETRRRDGFPDMVGYFCYQCLPPSLVEDEFRENFSCTVNGDSKFIGRAVECAYEYDEQGQPVPIRGCYYGITSKYRCKC